MTFALAVFLVRAMAQQPELQPDPIRILEGARLSATLTKLDEGLKGQLRKGRKRTPVTLFLKGENIQFQFSEDKKPWRIFHMRLGNIKSELFEFVNKKQIAFDRDKLVQPIAGSDLTYEDLAMGFFHWPNPKLIKEEEVSGQNCFRIKVEKPAAAHGRYESVDVWVHAKYGAFMRVRGYDARGGLLKEFQVKEVMQVADKVWTLEKMQISTHDPKSGRRLSISELSFDKPKSSRPKPRGGLR